jgi:hypothetical protein
MEDRALKAIVVVVVTEVFLVERGHLLSLVDESDPLVGGLAPCLI